MLQRCRVQALSAVHTTRALPVTRLCTISHGRTCRQSITYRRRHATLSSSRVVVRAARVATRCVHSVSGHPPPVRLRMAKNDMRRQRQTWQLLSSSSSRDTNMNATTVTRDPREFQQDMIPIILLLGALVVPIGFIAFKRFERNWEAEKAQKALVEREQKDAAHKKKSGDEDPHVPDK